METFRPNDVLYVCSIVEYIGRETDNRRSDVVEKLGRDRLQHLYEYADVNHCLPLEQVAEELISDAGIETGSFMPAADCAYRIPHPTEIGSVYLHLIEDTRTPDESAVDGMIRVFRSFLSDLISNFSSAVFYSGADYLRCCLLEGHLLNW